MKKGELTRLALAIGVLALVAADSGSGLSRIFVRDATAEAQPAADTRQRVALAAQEQDAVLAEMRQMLGSVSGVLHGLAAGDRGAIEKAARMSGMVMAVDPRLEQKLPRQFLEMGMATHHKFDRLADAARAGASPDEVLKSLADLTTNCVACHAMFRF